MNPQVPCSNNCGRMANVLHHQIYRCKGGSDDAENLQPLCFKCHTQLHSLRGDYRMFGRNGGKSTAKSPRRWMKKLKQFRNLSRRDFDRELVQRLKPNLFDIVFEAEVITRKLWKNHTTLAGKLYPVPTKSS